MRIDTWFLGVRSFGQLEPKERLELLFHALRYLKDCQKLTTPESRTYYRETYAPYKSDDAIYNLFDNLWWLGAIKIEYKRDTKTPSAHYILTSKGRGIINRGYIAEIDYENAPLLFIKRLERPARKVPFYHLKYILASYDIKKRHIEIEFEGDIPVKWWDIQKEKEEQRGEENVIIRGIRSAVEEIVDDNGYSSSLFTDETPEGGEVSVIETPTTRLEFRVIDYDQLKNTIEGYGEAPDLFWSVGTESEISDIVINYLTIQTFFKGKAGFSGKTKTLKEF